MTFTEGTSFGGGQRHTYIIGGVEFPWFVMGDLERNDDFFLAGIEAEEGEFGPVLTGCVLNSEGEVLFRLNRNRLDVNPGQCSKIDIAPGSYEIHDDLNQPILKVQTVFNVEGDDSHETVSTISGTFFGRDKTVRVKAEDTLTIDGPFATENQAGDYNGLQRMFLDSVMQSNGVISQLRSGLIQGEEVNLDGTFFSKPRFVGCTLVTSTGQFVLHNPEQIANCSFRFEGPAAAIKEILTFVMLNSLGHAVQMKPTTFEVNRLTVVAPPQAAPVGA